MAAVDRERALWRSDFRGQSLLHAASLLLGIGPVPRSRYRAGLRGHRVDAIDARPVLPFEDRQSERGDPHHRGRAGIPIPAVKKHYRRKCGIDHSCSLQYGNLVYFSMLLDRGGKWAGAQASQQLIWHGMTRLCLRNSKSRLGGLSRHRPAVWSCGVRVDMLWQSRLVYLSAQRLVEHGQPALNESRLHRTHRLAARGFGQNPPIQQFVDQGFSGVVEKGDGTAPVACKRGLVAPTFILRAVPNIAKPGNPEQKIYPDRVRQLAGEQLV